jgi:hypothetical protein
MRSSVTCRLTQRATRGRGADRRAAPLVAGHQPAGADADRRGVPILAVEATLAALTSFTMVAPLGLPWWLPIIGVAVIGTASAGLRQLALLKGRELWRGLAVLRRSSQPTPKRIGALLPA